MRILCCHNYYQQRGGEDQSFEDEVALLREHGHDVATYTRHNDDIQQMPRLQVAGQTFWNRRTAKELRPLLVKHRPEVVHFTNTFPLISPSGYREAHRAGAAVVQSVRNYRMMCAGAYFLRDGKVCEDCLGKRLPWPAVKHRCYRGSAAGSAVVAGSNLLHRTLGTMNRGVDAFYTLTEFSRGKLIEAGLPADRLLVKPNCVNPDPGPGGGGDYAVFAGRLSPEKGIRTLLDAWDRLESPLPLRILGDGPLQEEVAAYAERRPHVRWLGRRPQRELLEMVGGASLLVMPSVWYETFGRTIIEAYAKGTPVVASRLGAMAELVREGKTGFTAQPGDALDLARSVTQLQSLPAEAMATMRRRCRQEYEAHYTPARNGELLLAVYRCAIEARGNRVSPSPSKVPASSFVGELSEVDFQSPLQTASAPESPSPRL